MRHIQPSAITDAVAELCQRANFELPADLVVALTHAREVETSEIARDVLDQLLLNARLASEGRVAACQDTGLAVVFVELGREVCLAGDLQEAIDEGVRQGYRDGFLRASVIRDPLHRDTNTGDNTPAIMHLRLVAGDRVKLTVAPKGGGSENMSALWMLTPSEGREGVISRIVSRIREAGGKACPPLILGVGLGGTMDKAALLAKEALLRDVGTPSPLPEVAALEADILEAVNATGIGPMGLGGRTTALAVHVERHPCHLASLPLALNVQCHSARRASLVL